MLPSPLERMISHERNLFRRAIHSALAATGGVESIPKSQVFAKCAPRPLPSRTCCRERPYALPLRQFVGAVSSLAQTSEGDFPAVLRGVLVDIGKAIAANTQHPAGRPAPPTTDATSVGSTHSARAFREEGRRENAWRTPSARSTSVARGQDPQRFDSRGRRERLRESL